MESLLLGFKWHCRCHQCFNLLPLTDQLLSFKLCHQMYRCLQPPASFRWLCRNHEILDSCPRFQNRKLTAKMQCIVKRLKPWKYENYPVSSISSHHTHEEVELISVYDDFTNLFQCILDNRMMIIKGLFPSTTTAYHSKYWMQSQTCRTSQPMG